MRTVSGVIFCSPRSKIYLLILLILFEFFLTNPRYPIPNSGSSILDPWSWFSSTPRSLFFFSSTEVSNQHFQAIEFVDQPIPEKLNMGFLFYEHEVLEVVCLIFKYKATRSSWSYFQEYSKVKILIIHISSIYKSVTSHFKNCENLSINPFAPGDFAEKRVLKLVEWFSGHCRAIKS